MERKFRTVGFWAGVLSALFAVLWFITFSMQDVFVLVPEWQDLEAYAEAYRMVRLTLVYPSLLLALTYIALMACVHRYASEENKVWSLIALSIGILYATMASINYNIQAVSVRQSLAAGEVGGIQMFIPDNPHSIYTALANSYVYMALSMIAAGFVFEGGGLKRWIRWLFFVQIISVIGQAGWSMFDLPMTAFIISSMVWVIGAPVAFVLIAVLFRQEAAD